MNEYEYIPDWFVAVPNMDFGVGTPYEEDGYDNYNYGVVESFL